jgi:hypothetical protein
MDRRNLLALAAALPIFASPKASACSPVLRSPRSTGLENQQVRKLFNAWWVRDQVTFRALFTKTLMADGSPMEPKLAAELRAQSPLPRSTFDIFDRFFTDQRKASRLNLMVNTAAGVIVACAEGISTNEIQPDCTGMPALHLFLVEMSGLNPRAITHLSTTHTVEPGSFSVWTGE